MPSELAANPRLSSPVFALPVNVVDSHLEALKAVGVTPKRRTVTVAPFEVDAYEFGGATAETTEEVLISVMSVLGSGPFALYEKARIGRRVGPLFCGVQGEVTLIPLAVSLQTPRDEDDEEEEKPEPEPGETDSFFHGRVRRILERVSRLTGGLSITLHPESRGKGYPPLPDRPGHINLYTWTAPPGDSEDYFLRKAFKLSLDMAGKGVLTYRGVPGRGEFVGDGKNDLVQLVGNNWYILVCVFEFAHQHATEKLVEQLLAASVSRWQALRRGARPRNRAEVLNRAGFVKTASGWAHSLSDALTQEVEKQRKILEDNRREYARVLRLHLDAKRDLAALRDGAVLHALLDSLPKQWSGIRRNPRVADVSRVGDGLHITTVPIVIEHAGARYPLGRFVIRFNKQGVLTLWNTERLHPDGIPHPHIDRTGHPCYGNASAAIESAMAEHRYSDAVEYVTRWLADGYEQALAQHPISEWPVAEVPHA